MHKRIIHKVAIEVPDDGYNLMKNILIEGNGMMPEEKIQHMKEVMNAIEHHTYATDDSAPSITCTETTNHLEQVTKQMEKS